MQASARRCSIGRAEIIKSGHETHRHRGRKRLRNPRAAFGARMPQPYIDALYKRLQRRGALYRDCVRMVTNDRNIYGASMVAAGDADALVTGVTRAYGAALERCAHGAGSATRPASHRRDAHLHQGPRDLRRRHQRARDADSRKNWRTSRSRRPASHGVSAIRRAWPCSPIRPSGFRRSERSQRLVEAVQILDQRGVDFEYDGEMARTWRSIARRWRSIRSAA